MNEYLIQILKIENTVIIPGLGALMVTNSKTGAVMFNPHLKFNDKTLEKYVEENSNMDAQETSNFVAKFSQEILSQLDKGESYDIFGLGKFVKNGDEIEFLQDTDGSAPKKESTPPAVEAKKEEKPEPVKEVKKEEPKEIREEKKEVKEEPKKEEQKTVVPPVAPPVVEAKKETPKKEEKKEPAKNVYVEPSDKKSSPKEEVKSKEEKIESLKKAGVKPTKTMEKAEKDKKPKKKRGLKIFLIILLLLLLGSGGYIGMNWDRYQYVFGLKSKDDVAKVDEHKEDIHDDSYAHTDSNSEEAKHSDTDENTDESDSLNNEENANTTEEVSTDSQEENIAEEPVVEEEPVKVVESTESFESNGSRGGNGDYHVVVGLFQNPSNADKLVSTLKGSGHDATILGTFDGLQMVVVKSFPNRDAAISSMREIRSSIEDRAWVFRY